MAVVPKSEKLQKEDQAKRSRLLVAPDFASDEASVAATPSGPIKIRKVECANEFMAVLRDAIESTIALPDGKKFRDEGVVIGVGPGLPCGNGSRTPSQFAIGDVVVFQSQHIVTEVQSSTFYKDKSVVIINERSILCKLRKVQFELVD